MHGLALRVLGKGNLGVAVVTGTNVAGNERALVQSALRDQKGEGGKAAGTGDNLIFVDAFRLPDGEVLDQAVRLDAVSQFPDIDGGIEAPNVGRAWNKARQGNFLDVR